jgi:hypothetical protein
VKLIIHPPILSMPVFPVNLHKRPEIHAMLISVSCQVVKLLEGSGDRMLFCFLDRIEVLSEKLVHREHMHLVLLKNRLHLAIAKDLSLVGRVLQASLFDVSPNLLDDLRSRELLQ